MKQRVSKSEIEMFIKSQIKAGDTKISDRKEGPNRVIITNRVRVTITPNSWVEIQPLNLK